MSASKNELRAELLRLVGNCRRGTSLADDHRVVFFSPGLSGEYLDRLEALCEPTCPKCKQPLQ